MKPMPAPAQPSFDDLGPPLADVRFCVVDLETTGTGGDAAITEIGAVLVQGGQVLGEFQTLVNPQDHIPGLITVLTGITDQMVVDAPGIDEALPPFLEFAAGAVLVAHNASFDVGFLKRACTAVGLAWPGFAVVDTMVLARAGLLRDEVPNVKLGTLAAHFHATTQPDHRALSDARATVDVLHGLFERLGNLGVTTLDDIAGFTGRVPPQRRAKRVWAKSLPNAPGVYWFKGPNDEVLYVGKSANLRRRVATYFTSSETRARIDEMVRVAIGVDYIVCATALEAEVRELRLIAAHSPRYNRRSKRQRALRWLKLTAEPVPRLCVVRTVGTDPGTYWGPFTARDTADDALAALQDAWGLRTCSTRLRGDPVSRCALGDLGRCLAPCDPHNGADYEAAVASAKTAARQDIRPTIAASAARIRTLSSQQRFEEADDAHRRLTALMAASLRWHRLQALGSCRQIVAARLVGDTWHIHVIRHGWLAAAATAPPGANPRRVATQAVALAGTVRPGPRGLPAGTVEEAERIADWLEGPGTRLMDIDGDLSWPTFAGVSAASLPALIWAMPGNTDHALHRRRTSAMGACSHCRDQGEC